MSLVVISPYCPSSDRSCVSSQLRLLPATFARSDFPRFEHVTSVASFAILVRVLEFVLVLQLLLKTARSVNVFRANSCICGDAKTRETHRSRSKQSIHHINNSVFGNWTRETLVGLNSVSTQYTVHAPLRLPLVNFLEEMNNTYPSGDSCIMSAVYRFALSAWIILCIFVIFRPCSGDASFTSKFAQLLETKSSQLSLEEMVKKAASFDRHRLSSNLLHSD